MSAHILDVLLIFSIVLSAAIVAITFSARRVVEVPGFPLLVVAITTLRMAVGVSCAKLILLRGESGSIISFLGGAFAWDNNPAAMVLFGVSVLIIFGIVSRISVNIARSGTDFVCGISTMKQTDVDRSARAGVINRERAAELRKEIVREAVFFAGMSRAGRFMLCDAVVEFAVITASMVSGMIAGAVTSAKTGMPAGTYVSLAAGAGTTAQVSALLVAAACAYFVRKNTATVAVEGGFSGCNAINAGGDGDIEALRRRMVGIPTSSGQAQCGCEIIDFAAETRGETEKRVITEDLEWYEGVDSEESAGLWVWEEIKGSDYSKTMAELIGTASGGEAKTILMAAENVKELPVTVPVNVAMRLAERGDKCILIDLDMERGAVSKVFEIGHKTNKKAAATCVANLWVLAAENFRTDRASTVKNMIAELEEQYDYVVVYAPNIRKWDCGKIAETIEAAMLFGPDGKIESSTIKDFREVLSESGCTIIRRDSCRETMGKAAG
jgi:hypothetical protein